MADLQAELARFEAELAGATGLVSLFLLIFPHAARNVYKSRQSTFD